MATFTRNVPIVTETPTISVEDLPPGQHRFQLVVEDEQGNRSQPSEAAVIVESPVTSISSLKPSYGAWGDSVEVSGKYFEAEPAKNVVAFNGIQAAVVSSSETQIGTSVPANATTGFVTVRTRFNEARSPIPFLIPRMHVIEVGPRPIDLACDDVKGQIWVVNGDAVDGNTRIAIISLDALKVVKTVDTKPWAEPREIALAPAGDRRYAIVTNGRQKTLSIIDMETFRYVAAGVEGIPFGAAISPDGRWGYAVIQKSDTDPSGLVGVVDLAKATKTVSPYIEVGKAPTRVVFGRDGREAFVNNTGDGTVSVIDVASQRVSDVIRVGSEKASPQEVALSSETYPAWTANSGGPSTTRMEKDHSTKEISIGTTPGGVAVSPNGARAFLTGPRDNVMAVVDFADGGSKVKMVRMSAEGGGPKGIAVTPNGRGVMVVHPVKSMVSLVNPRGLDLEALVRTPDQPLRCVITGDSRFACISCEKGNALVVIPLASVLP